MELEDEKHGESWGCVCTRMSAPCVVKGSGEMSFVCQGLVRGLSSSRWDAVGTDASSVCGLFWEAMEAAGGRGVARTPEGSRRQLWGWHHFFSARLDCGIG